jgi:hypothetical protein
MRRVKTVGVCVSLMIFGTLYACGGDDSTPALGVADSGGGGNTDGSSALDTGVTTGDGAIITPPTDGGTPGDGSITIIDGGVPSNPGAVSCGPSVNCTAGNFCCADPADGGFSCQNGGGSCPGTAGHLECDETADCNLIADAALLVCCYEVADGVVSSSCHADCNGGGGNRFQACKAQSECTTGTCAAHTCLDGQHIESCKAETPACP